MPTASEDLVKGDNSKSKKSGVVSPVPPEDRRIVKSRAVLNC